MEYLVGQDIPLNATEIFGIAQAVTLIETYQRAVKKTGKSPMLYISHIAGIYDDHLKKVVQEQNIDNFTGCARPSWHGCSAQTLHNYGRT